MTFSAHRSFDSNTECEFIASAAESFKLISDVRTRKREAKMGVTKLNGDCKPFILLTLFSLGDTHGMGVPSCLDRARKEKKK